MVEQADESSQVFQSRMDEFSDEVRNLERLIEANKYKSESAQKELERAQKEISLEQDRMGTLKDELESAANELEVAEEAAGFKQSGLDKELAEKHEREANLAAAYIANKNTNTKRDQVRERYHEVRARYTSLKELAEGATDVAGSFAKIKEEDPASADCAMGLLTDFISFGEDADELPPKAKASLERWSERLIIEDFGNFNTLVRAANKLELGTLPVSVLSLAESIDASEAAQWADKFGAEKVSTFIKVDSGDARISKIIDRLYILSSLAVDDETLITMPRGIVLFTAQGISYAGQDKRFIVKAKVPTAVYFFFDNDQKGFAPNDAMALMKNLGLKSLEKYTD